MEDKALTHTQLALHQTLHTSLYWAVIYFNAKHAIDGNKKIYTYMCASIHNSSPHLLQAVMSGVSVPRLI